MRNAEFTGAWAVLYLLFTIAVFVLPLWLWATAMIRCWGRSRSFSIVVTALSGWIVLGTCAGLGASRRLQYGGVAGWLLYFVYVATPAYALWRKRKGVRP